MKRTVFDTPVTLALFVKATQLTHKPPLISNIMVKHLPSSRNEKGQFMSGRHSSLIVKGREQLHELDAILQSVLVALRGTHDVGTDPEQQSTSESSTSTTASVSIGDAIAVLPDPSWGNSLQVAHFGIYAASSALVIASSEEPEASLISARA